MNNIYYAEINKETGDILGYYIKDIHGEEKITELLSNGAIAISEELWQRLLSGNYRLKESKEKELFAIEDFSLFEERVKEQPPLNSEPTQEERIKALENLMLEVL